MALFTLTELKTFLGISGTTEDAQLTPMVAAVNAWVLKYLDRGIEKTTYTGELYDGTGTASLILRNYPVSAVTKVLIENEELKAVDYDDRVESGTDGYWIKDADTGILFRSSCWPRGRGLIKVSYTAGYDEIPDDLKYCCYRIASYLRNVQKKPGLVAESLGSYSYSLAGPQSGLDIIQASGVGEILDHYKRFDHGLVY